jgi:hypothetical protein
VWVLPDWLWRWCNISKRVDFAAVGCKVCVVAQMRGASIFTIVNTAGILIKCIYSRAQAIFRAKPFHVQYPTLSTAVTLHTHSPTKMEQTECSEILAFKLQASGNNPEKSVQHNKPNLCCF